SKFSYFYQVCLTLNLLWLPNDNTSASSCVNLLSSDVFQLLSFVSQPAHQPKKPSLRFDWAWPQPA
ncbi:MAG: hypothetical protein ACFB4I_14460, partial [Cyanophyceae cyanobacterium]